MYQERLFIKKKGASKENDVIRPGVPRKKSLPLDTNGQKNYLRLFPDVIVLGEISVA